MIDSSNPRFNSTRRLRPGVALASLVLCILGPAGLAQNVPTHPTNQAQRAHRVLSVDTELHHLSVALHLTSEQQASVRLILERRRAQMLQVHAAESLTAMDRFTKLQAVDKEAVDKISAALTDEQRKIFQARRQRPDENHAAAAPSAATAPAGSATPAPPSATH